MKKVVEVSFKEDELYLIHEIEKRTKLSSKSGWIKQAIAEKIERENNREIKLIDDFIRDK
jgi:hypothetical protein